jgi:hypothetical protein
MVDSLYLQSAVWALTTSLELLLLFLLLRRKAASRYPLFTAYLFSAILQSVAVAQIHRMTELDKWTAWVLEWGTQAVVTIMRSLAIVELAGKVVGAYPGIWMLAKRLLLFVGCCVLAYALVLSKGQWQWFILNGVRGFELAAAAVIVTMLLFARFYSLPIRLLPRALAIGFCLYSAFYVINYSLLEKTVQQFGDFWNFLGIVTFLASLLLWLNAAARYTAVEDKVNPPSIPPELYGRLSSEVNLRLHLLNRQLMLLLHAEERRP